MGIAVKIWDTTLVALEMDNFYHFQYNTRGIYPNFTAIHAITYTNRTVFTPVS